MTLAKARHRAVGGVIGRRTEACRLCSCEDLETVLDLGPQALTGIFPGDEDDAVPVGPLELVRCTGGCGLVQLAHVYPPEQLYGAGYGYRSGLNPTMVQHLESVATDVCRFTAPGPGDVIVDVGSNDGTLLRQLASTGATRVGVDPAGEVFASYYDSEATVVNGLFPGAPLPPEAGPGRVRAVTSIAMFYDLDEPLEFARAVRELLVDGGVWITEQAYLPVMLTDLAYDVVCHEHQEYYALRQLAWITERTGFGIEHVELNRSNGGSFRVVARKGSPHHAPAVARFLEREAATGLGDPNAWRRLAEAVGRHGQQLRDLLRQMRDDGMAVLGYGASTKGNVLLQHSGIGPELLPAIVEVNEDKFGRRTPGTGIPIISEAEGRERRPDAYLVLPWHFRDFFVEKERDFLAAGGKLIFPLPRIEIV